LKEERTSSSSFAWTMLRREIISCTRCPRLVRYREKVARDKKKQFMNWKYWGAPLPGFGDPQAQLVMIGLAPAAHGGNRTGRMFTGDGSASFLMRALHAAGFSNQPTSQHSRDGLRLENSFMTAVVRCPPPQNKPSATELASCSSYLDRELALMPCVRVILALGRLAFKGYLDHVKRRCGHVQHWDFKHGGIYSLPAGFPVLVASYHPSRQNTQTGRLTDRMMDRVLSSVKKLLAGTEG
jgi:uracil-DNA glycosylase family 4